MAAIGVTREGSQLKKGHFVSLLVPVIAAGLVALPAAGSNGNGGGNSLWNSSLTATNVVVSQPTTGGGYTDVGNAPVPGKCGPGPFNANHSESWLAVKPATDTIVGSSKFFFDKYSTFYNFYLGSYRIQNGAALNNTIVQGYDCTTVGTQAMPPSWTNTTDPNVDFDTMVAFTRPSCLSMRTGRTCIRTGRSPSRTATTLAIIGSPATVGSHSKSHRTRVPSVSSSKTSSGSPSITLLETSTRITYMRCGPSSAGAATRPTFWWPCLAIAGKPSPRR